METKTMRRQSRVKRLVKLLISSAFFAGVGVWRGLCRLCGKQTAGAGVVLYYHSIPSDQRAAFAGQLDTILRYAKPVPADLRGPLKGAAHYVAITFDDGFENVIENALPELEKRRIPSTLFIIAGGLGKFPHWLTSRSEREQHGKLMTAHQLKQLPSDLVTIGSHTMTHPTLPTLNSKEARREISESRAALENLLNRKVDLFSFPRGAFNQELVRCCQEAGYERIFNSLPLMAFADSEEFLTGRVWAEPTDWRLEFRLKILGAYRWLPLAFAAKRNLLSYRTVSRTPALRA